MVALETFARLVGGVVLLFANGFFVTTEFAMTRVRQFPQEQFTGHPGLERAWEMTERLEIYLSGCQVGITVSSVGLGVVAEPALAALLDPVFEAVGFGTGGAGHTAAAVITALAIINLLHVIIGEQAPTYLGVERARFVSKHGSWPLYYWTKLMSPVIVFADRIAKGLLKAFGVTITRAWAEEEEMEEGGEGGPRPSSRAEARTRMGDTLSGLGLSRDRREEVISALEIDRVTAQDIMVPAESVTFLRSDDTLDENLERMREAPHVRFPLLGEHSDSFEGIVYTPSVLRELDALEAGEQALGDVAAPPLTVDVDTAVSELIDRFQEERQELALVEDEGSVVGLVTVTDAMEVITGQVQDPLDESAADD